MERLTDKSFTKACCDPWDFCGLDSVCKRDCFKPTPCKIPALVYRLAQIEDILGDNYDLENLKNLVNQKKSSNKNWQYKIETHYSLGSQYYLFHFYMDGVYKRSKAVFEQDKETYMKSLEKSGWKFAYSKEQMNDLKNEIQDIEEKLVGFKKKLKEMKNNLIIEKEENNEAN